jgi:putative ABC transport system substrate-binding protein
MRPHPWHRFVLALAGAGCLGLAACGLVERGQAPVPRVMYLYIGSSPAAEFTDFREELHLLGYTEGKSILVEDSGVADGAQLPEQVGRLLDATAATTAPTVVLTFGTRATQVIKNEMERRRTAMEKRERPAQNLPRAVVMASTSDPAGTGLVENLARPGGFVTGLTSNAPSLAAKRLELLKDVLESRRQVVQRVAVVLDPEDPGDDKEWAQSVEAADRLGLQIVRVGITAGSQIEGRLSEAVDQGAGALVPLSSAVLVEPGSRRALVDFAARYRLLAFYPRREFVADCGMAAYGPDYRAMYRRAATYVDKILKGADPATLPVEKAQRFALSVNLQVFRSFDVRPSPSFQAQVDEVTNDQTSCTP